MLARLASPFAPYNAEYAIKCATDLESMQKEDVFRIVDDSLLFRGTLSWKELLTEVRVGRAKWDDGGSIHRGFFDLYRNIRGDVMDAVGSRRISHVCGHSLGGVFAILAAQDLLRYNKSIPRAVYTFGAPRVGNDKFVRSVTRNHPIYRITNEEDVITQIPPLCRHVGDPIIANFDSGSILDNHALCEYRSALRSQIEHPGWYSWLDSE